MPQVDDLESVLSEWKRWLHLDEKQASAWQQQWQSLPPETQELATLIRGKHLDEQARLQAYRHGRQHHQALQPWRNHYAGWIDWRSNQTGLKRLSHCVAALLEMHLDGLEALPCLRGSLHKSASATRVSRHFMVLWQGQAYVLQGSDEHGHAATPAQIEHALYDLLQEALPDEEVLPFTAFSQLPEKRFQEVKGRLRQDAHNQVLWQQCHDALFSLCIEHQHYSESLDHLAAAAFSDSAGFFSHKPINYRVSIKDQRYGVHSELGACHPLVLAQCLQQAQEIFERGRSNRRNALSPDLNRQQLQWHLSEDLEALLWQELAQQQRQVERLMISSCDLFLSEDDRALLMRHQPPLVLLLAFQYALWRSQKGQDTMRAVFHDLDQQRSTHLISQEALQLCQALWEERGSFESLWLQYQKEWERRVQLKLNPCLYWMLWEEALQQKRFKVDASLLKKLLHPDCNLEIVRMTGLQKIKNIAFVPQAEGFAISYAVQRNNISILISHYRHKLPEVQRYLQELKYACKDLLRHLARLND